MLHGRFPDEKEAINKFVAIVEECTTPGYKQAAAWLFKLKAVTWMPAMLRSFLVPVLSGRFWHHCMQTAEEVLRDDCGVDPDSLLGSVLLGQYSDAGVRPDKLSASLYLGVIAHYINGSTYPVGGSGQIPRKMNAVVRAAGGCSFVQARVEGTLVEGGKCTGVVCSGMPIKSRFVVSSAGALASYHVDIAPHVPASQPYIDLNHAPPIQCAWC